MIDLKNSVKKVSRTNVKDFLIENRLLIFLSIMLLIGIFFGSMLINFSDDQLIKFINTLFLSDFKERLSKPLLDVFIASMSSTFIFVLMAFFMGLSVWGVILAPIIPFIRGICVGLCEAYLYTTFGLKGVCFHFLVFLPGIFISSIAVLLITREAIKISNCFYLSLQNSNKISSLSNNIKLYLIHSGSITIIIFISSVIDLLSNVLFSKFFYFNL